MSDGAAPLAGGEGIGEATSAFQASLDAETPSRSTKREARKEESKIPLEDLFPRRDMDRREPEGGANTVPEVVKKAREKAGKTALTDDESPEPQPRKARRPTEETDDAEPDAPEDDELDDDEIPDDPEGEEEGDEEPDDDGPDDDEGPQGDLDLDQIVEVNIDGQPKEVSLNEAIRGYIRTETFHQRMGELAQGVQALNSQKGEVDQTRAAVLARAEALEAYVQAFMPEEPNWDALYAQDPVKASAYERQWRSFTEKVNGLKASRAQTQAELAASEQARIAQFAQANRQKLAAEHPEWKNEKNWRRDHESMRKTARTAGYTDQELGQLYDARGVEILLKAAKYDRMMATKPKPVARTVTPNSNGRGSTPPRRNGRTTLDRAEARLSRTGSVNDAAAVFERLLDHER